MPIRRLKIRKPISPKPRRWNAGRIAITSVVDIPNADRVVGNTVSGLTKRMVASTPNAKPDHANLDNTLAAVVQGAVYDCPDSRIMLVDACVGSDKDIPTKGFEEWHQRRSDLFHKNLNKAGYARNSS